MQAKFKILFIDIKSGLNSLFGHFCDMEFSVMYLMIFHHFFIVMELNFKSKYEELDVTLIIIDIDIMGECEGYLQFYLFLLT